MEEIAETTLTILDEATPDRVPEGSAYMTAMVEVPPGHVGTPPHRHSGPVFGYVTEGELLFELEGEEPRTIEAGQAFWEPGGEVVHWLAANARDDVWTRFVVVMVCTPDVPMLVHLTEDERAERQSLRHPNATYWR